MKGYRRNSSNGDGVGSLDEHDHSSMKGYRRNSSNAYVGWDFGAPVYSSMKGYRRNSSNESVVVLDRGMFGPQ